MPILNIRVEGITCTPPILVSVTHVFDKSFDLVWDYDGVDYSSDPTTTISIYISNDDIVYELFPPIYDYPQTTATVDLKDKLWEIFYFKLKLVNRDCNEFSNTIMKTI
jgi:hypothetical protein